MLQKLLILLIVVRIPELLYPLRGVEFTLLLHLVELRSLHRNRFSLLGGVLTLEQSLLLLKLKLESLLLFKDEPLLLLYFQSQLQLSPLLFSFLLKDSLLLLELDYFMVLYNRQKQN